MSTDFAFFDHDKDAYLDDLMSILDRGWLRPGAVVVADNVRIPGAPKYREYMRRQQGTLWKTVEHKAHLEYQSLVSDLVLESEFVGSFSREQTQKPPISALDGGLCVCSRHLLRPRVGPGPHLAQRVHGDQRVDLRGRHRGVTQ